jgi:hypothetical protein
MPKSADTAAPPTPAPPLPRDPIAALTQWQHSAAQMRRLIAAHTEAQWRFGLMWGDLLMGNSQAARDALRSQAQTQAEALTAVSTTALKAMLPAAQWGSALAPALQAVLRDGEDARADLIAAQQETLDAITRSARGVLRT